METKAYILIETSVGKLQDVAKDLRDLLGVDNVDLVTGPYDIIAVIGAENLNLLGDFITSKVHSVKGIVRTVTCLSVGGK